MRCFAKVVLVSMAVMGGSLAFAHNCPNEMKAIDAKLAAKPQLSTDNAAKVAKLRADGEAFHKAGQHSESMKALGEAKKLLGM